MKVRTPEPEGFADFWAIWQPHMRKTDGRFDARDGYRKHILDGAEPEDIIDGARWFIRDWSAQPREKQEWIPLAKSWLNKGAYMDLCERERDYQRRKAELEAAKAAQNSNIHVLHQPSDTRGSTRGSPDKSPDNRPSEEERAAQVAAARQRLGIAAQG